MNPQIHIHRIYDPLPEELAGCRRILIDRLWPRGISKQHADLDYWARDIAPSDALRKWYRHDHAKWEEFKVRYFAELDANPVGVANLLEHLVDQEVVFLFSSKEREYNNASALRIYLTGA
ncbi:MAG: DUF488 family protein [Saprospiraceae bacterium]|nr:DUF488 family protein [Saprospiraceae bacterium]